MFSFMDQISKAYDLNLNSYQELYQWSIKIFLTFGKKSGLYQKLFIQEI